MSGSDNEDYGLGGGDQEEVIGNVIVAPSIQINVDELIAATVRAVLSSEMGKRSTDLKSLLPNFGESLDDDVVSWFDRVDRIKRLHRAKDEDLLLTVISKLRGKPLDWYYSKPEYISLSLAELRKAMVNMFSVREDAITMMRRFEGRKWRRNEKFCTYYLDKVVLGNKVGLSEQNLITYIIEGFDNPMLQSQAKMKEFCSLNQLLKVMNEISSGERFSGSTTPGSGVKYRGEGWRSDVPEASGSGFRSEAVDRCYNCSGTGHIASACLKPKREMGSCFTCGDKGHQRRDCPENKEQPGVQSRVQSRMQPRVQPAQANSTAMLVDNKILFIPKADYTIKDEVVKLRGEIAKNNVIDLEREVQIQKDENRKLHDEMYEKNFKIKQQSAEIKNLKERDAERTEKKRNSLERLENQSQMFGNVELRHSSSNDRPKSNEEVNKIDELQNRVQRLNATLEEKENIIMQMNEELLNFKMSAMNALLDKFVDLESDIEKIKQRLVNKDKKKLFEGGLEKTTKNAKEKDWKDKLGQCDTRQKAKLPKWFGERPSKSAGDPESHEGEEEAKKEDEVDLEEHLAEPEPDEPEEEEEEIDKVLPHDRYIIKDVYCND